MVRRVSILAAVLLAGCSVRTSVGDLPEGSAVVDSEGVDDESGSTSSNDDATTGPAVPATSTTTDAPGSSSSSGDEGDELQPSMTAFSIRWGDIPPSDDTDITTDTSTTRGGTDRDDDDIMVVIGFTTESCEDPSATDGCETWSMSFFLDAARQQPGTYQLVEDVAASILEQGPAEDDGTCFGTGGSVDGTVVIETYNESEVTGRLESVDFGPSAFDLDGFEFTAPRC